MRNKKIILDTCYIECIFALCLEFEKSMLFYFVIPLIFYHILMNYIKYVYHIIHISNVNNIRQKYFNF